MNLYSVYNIFILLKEGEVIEAKTAKEAVEKFSGKKVKRGGRDIVYEAIKIKRDNWEKYKEKRMPWDARRTYFSIIN